ncbi:MAG TPA: FHA domain-containing protein [bacterium]|nr:FHA domain-containing protein [bacterium]
MTLSLQPTPRVRSPLSAPSAASPIREIFEKVQGHFAENRPLPKWARAELDSLEGESAEDMLAQALLQIAGRLQNHDHLEAAAFLFGCLAEARLQGPIPQKAKARLGAMSGESSVGSRAEFLTSRIFKDAADSRLLVPMIGAGFLGRVATCFAWGRMLAPAARSTGSFISPRLVAGSTGYLAEVLAFAGLSHALSRGQGSAAQELTHSALTVGALRFAGLSAGRLGGQGAALAGLILAQQGEERLGLRSPQSHGFLEALASMFSLQLGARLGHSLGRRLRPLEAELSLRSRSLPRRESPERLPGMAWAAEGSASALPSSRPPASQGMEILKMGKLESESCHIRFIDTQKPLSIGRAADNVIVIPKPQISEHHAEIDFRNHPDILIRDLNSASGTFVRDARLDPRLAVNLLGQHLRLYTPEIRVGPIRIEVKIKRGIPDFSDLVVVRSVGPRGERWSIQLLSAMK